MPVHPLYNTIFNYLIEHKQTNDPDLTFSLRKRDNKSRLSRGYWFQGNDGYMFLPFYKKGDSKNKTKTIGFVIILNEAGDSGTQYLELAYQSETDQHFLEFYSRLKKVLATSLDIAFEIDKQGRARYFFPDSDVLKNLESFLNEFKPIIDSLIKEMDLEEDFFITKEEFDKTLDRINKIRERGVLEIEKEEEVLAHIEEDDLVDVDLIREYLEEFKAAANAWFKENGGMIRERHSFFKSFFEKENIRKATWEDFQDLGKYLHSFQSMPLAKANALGRPNHPIEHYRKVFEYLIYGEDPIEKRLNSLVDKHSSNYLKNFGRSSLSELVGYAFADKYVFYNRRDVNAVELLGIPLGFARGDKFGDKFVKFNEAIQVVLKLYKEEVGEPIDIPLALQVDQFFSWLYTHYELLEEDEDDDEEFDDEIIAENFWWLNASPKIWSIDGHPQGKLQTYTTRNEKGNKRRIYKYFEAAIPGDLIIGYESSPTKEVKAIMRITKGIHQSEKEGEGEAIEFEIVTRYTVPVTWNEVVNLGGLEECEVLNNNQGSLFKLKEEEFEIIRDRLDSKNIDYENSIKEKAVVPYDYTTDSDKIFISKDKFTQMVQLLQRKKNIILQGPPGVGKTFVAKKLGYAIMKETNAANIEMIQFHQSYSYEDFIQGLRPAKKGFELRNGIFYDFCKRAQAHRDQQFFIVIDEINRGNLSKIFGELMMLIEADKRSEKYQIRLTYSDADDALFFVPENLHIIGTMNTADRSLAIVDYALRRRFAFVDIMPDYGERFQSFLSDQGLSKGIISHISAATQKVNKNIFGDINLGSGFQIGHSYFCNYNQSVKEESWYTEILQFEIKPLLEEIWFDDLEQVNKMMEILSY